MQVVILCGGKGTRLREETEYRPKPLVPIGSIPILYHIMNIYSGQGMNDFILCLGYKGEMIRAYFRENLLPWWNITMIDTGQETLTGGRLKMVESAINGEEFMLTYGDGLANVCLEKLIETHRKNKVVATVTAIQPASRFGIIDIYDGRVVGFHEKPKCVDWINGGYFMFTREIFNHLDDGMIVDTTLPRIAKVGQLAAYKHTGFWKCMDTYRDYLELNKIWDKMVDLPWLS